MYLWKNLNTMANYIVTMVTTIQISKELVGKLQEMKIHIKESYEDIIWDLIEDRMELSEETKRDIEESMKEIERGEVYSLEEVKKELRI
jgi:predicted transcriptional regulator